LRYKKPAVFWVHATNTLITRLKGRKMLGVINNFDIMTHPIVTIQCFGWRFFFKALFAKHNFTFLTLLNSSSLFEPAPPESGEIVDRIVQLELRAKGIYTKFADKFPSDVSVKRFFEILASQEQDHADMLEFCKAATAHDGWKMNDLSATGQCVAGLESQMRQAENAVRSITSLDDAMRVVIQLESSEINQAFQNVFMASSSRFVKKLLKFRRATHFHMAFIMKRIPVLCPQMLQTSKQLNAKFA
jgi:hypothetical protein